MIPRGLYFFGLTPTIFDVEKKGGQDMAAMCLVSACAMVLCHSKRAFVWAVDSETA